MGLTAISGGAGGRLVLSESRNLRFGSMTVFYFAQGLPIGLFLTAIAAWLAANGGSPGDVAAVVAVTFLPWSFKFIGAAAMDRYTFLPMGRRRAWLIGAQSVMVAGLLVASLAEPTPADMALIGWIGFVIFCASAMQDVAVDGLAVDILPDAEQGPASAFMFGGQALGIAGGGVLGGYLLDNYGSGTAFLAFVPVVGAILALAIVLRERPGEKIMPWTKGEASAVSLEAHGNGWLTILGMTVRSLVRRDSLILIGGTGMFRMAAGALTAFWPIFATTKAGYSTSEYSAMIAIVGLVASVACMGIGSVMNVRLGPKRASMISILGYALIGCVYMLSPGIATIGYVFVVITLFWNMADTLTSVCTNPLRMRLCDKRVAATQFTIYNSLSNLLVPAGASAFAWMLGADLEVAVMPALVALVFAGVFTLSFLHVGRRVEHEEELAPRVD
jgi:PAT family beta-lactamase induction signal transducer AmpG